MRTNPHAPRAHRPPPRPLAHQRVTTHNGSDRISLIGFHDRGFVLQRAVRLDEARLQQSILALHQRVNGSSTNLSDGLRRGIEVLSHTHPGWLRRLWLLTDGYPNRETEHVDELLERARAERININTIGFGDSYDEALLKRISAATHNGRFVSVQSLRALTDALGVDRRPPRQHRAEHTAYAIDLSGSMVLWKMHGRAKIEVVQDALIQLLNYKLHCYA